MWWIRRRGIRGLGAGELGGVLMAHVLGSPHIFTLLKKMFSRDLQSGVLPISMVFGRVR